MPIFEHKNSDEREFIWKFRHYLSQNSEFLTLFLVAVDWSDESKIAEAVKIINQWTKMTNSQVLALLSGIFCLNDVNG
jgi:phosphatidylinositol 3-kinase